MAEIQLGLSVFMLQNYQLNQYGLFIARAYFERKFHFHNWSYLVVKYFRLPFYGCDQFFTSV